MVVASICDAKKAKGENADKEDLVNSDIHITGCFCS